MISAKENGMLLGEDLLKASLPMAYVMETAACLPPRPGLWGETVWGNQTALSREGPLGHVG